MDKKIIKLNSAIISAASVVGKKEHEGPLGQLFEMHDEEDRIGQKTWERAEAEMQRLSANTALSKCKMTEKDIDFMFAGDLINQCTSSAYGLLEYNVPFFGLYGACSTAVEGLMLSSVMTSYAVCERCLSVTSSHNCSAERQFRTPLEYGAQRTPTAQWTVTGAGAFVTENADGKNAKGKARIVEAMPGISVEKGIKDAGNMGAAMCSAAADTVVRYLKSSGKTVNDFDLIATGDLGWEGLKLFLEFTKEDIPSGTGKINDCGVIVYDITKQNVGCGGSGCGCSAICTAGAFYSKLTSGEYRNVAVIGTGAMMSPQSLKQGFSIPAVAHLVTFKSRI